MKDRKIVLVLVIAVLFLMFTSHLAVGATSGKTAQLTIFNLSAGCCGGPTKGIRSILESLAGVVEYNIEEASYTVTITFDATKTSIDKIMDELAQYGYSIYGEPRWR